MSPLNFGIAKVITGNGFLIRHCSAVSTLDTMHSRLLLRSNLWHQADQSECCYIAGALMGHIQHKFDQECARHLAH